MPDRLRRMDVYRKLETAFGGHNKEEIATGARESTGTTSEKRKGYFIYYPPQGLVATVALSEEKFEGVTRVAFGTCGHLTLDGHGRGRSSNVDVEEIKSIEFESEILYKLIRIKKLLLG